jgi:hypothetical protein
MRLFSCYICCPMYEKASLLNKIKSQRFVYILFVRCLRSFCWFIVNQLKTQSTLFSERLHIFGDWRNWRGTYVFLYNCYYFRSLHICCSAISNLTSLSGWPDVLWKIAQCPPKMIQNDAKLILINLLNFYYFIICYLWELLQSRYSNGCK